MWLGETNGRLRLSRVAYPQIQHRQILQEELREFMPNTASAKKRLRQNIVLRDRNRAVKSLVRKRVRAVREAVADGDLSKADEAFRVAAKQLDRAGTKRIIHPNAVSRYKSRMQRLIKSAK
jgi:small subunit ribosomal protein S20